MVWALLSVPGIWGWGVFLNSQLRGTSRSKWEETAVGWGTGLILFYYVSLLHFSVFSVTGSWLFRGWMVGGVIFTCRYLYRQRPFLKAGILFDRSWLLPVAGAAIILLGVNTLFPPYGWDEFKSTFPRALALLEGNIFFPRDITHPMFMEFLLYGLWQTNDYSFQEIWGHYYRWKPIIALSFTAIIFLFIDAVHDKRVRGFPLLLLVASLFIPVYWKHAQLLYSNLLFAFLILAFVVLARRFFNTPRPGIFDFFFFLLWGAALCQVRRLAPLYLFFTAGYYFIQPRCRNIFRTLAILGGSVGFMVWHFFVRFYDETPLVTDVAETLPRRVAHPDFLTLLGQNVVYFASSFFFSLKDSVGGRTPEEYLFFWVLLLLSFSLRRKQLTDWFHWFFLGGMTVFFIFLTWVTLPWNIWYSINRYYLPIFTLLYYNEIKSGGES